MGPALEFGDRFIRHTYVLTIYLTIVITVVLLGFKRSALPSFLIGSAIGLTLFWSIEFMVRRLIRPGENAKNKVLIRIYYPQQIRGARRVPLFSL